MAPLRRAKGTSVAWMAFFLSPFACRNGGRTRSTLCGRSRLAGVWGDREIGSARSCQTAAMRKPVRLRRPLVPVAEIPGALTSRACRPAASVVAECRVCPMHGACDRRSSAFAKALALQGAGSAAISPGRRGDHRHEDERAPCRCGIATARRLPHLLPCRRIRWRGCTRRRQGRSRPRNGRPNS